MSACKKFSLFHQYVIEIKPILESCDQSGHTQKCFNQILTFKDLYQHVKNQAIDGLWLSDVFRGYVLNSAIIELLMFLKFSCYSSINQFCTWLKLTQLILNFSSAQRSLFNLCIIQNAVRNSKKKLRSTFLGWNVTGRKLKNTFPSRQKPVTVSQ